LDIKNPNKVEEDLGDPVKILEKLHKAETDMEALQTIILEQLTSAIQNS
jgi:type I restriction enzyme M protein